jgi:hypothetical protein
VNSIWIINPDLSIGRLPGIFFYHLEVGAEFARRMSGKRRGCHFTQSSAKRLIQVRV